MNLEGVQRFTTMIPRSGTVLITNTGQERACSVLNFLTITDQDTVVNHNLFLINFEIKCVDKFCKKINEILRVYYLLEKGDALIFLVFTQSSVLILYYHVIRA